MKKGKDHEKPDSKKLHGTLSSETSSSAAEKQGKNIRFRLPSAADAESEENFKSAVSLNLAEDEDDSFEDVLQTEPLPAVPRKFNSTPLRYSVPRKAPLKHCLVKGDTEPDYLLLAASSSRQLLEILKHSPTPSDADLNLINATYLRKLSAVKDAIQSGANVNTFRDKQTPLLIATEMAADRLVAYLLTVPDINPDFQNDFGQTALMIAVGNAFDKIVRLLLNHNADVNLPDTMGRTPLHEALFQQRPHLTKLLLAYGADVEMSDCFGEKPIYTAAIKRPNLECLLTLMKMGASTEYSDDKGISLLSKTIITGTHFEVVAALVENGASVNSGDYASNKTPLHFAALTNDLRAAKYLVNQGADVKLRTTYNFTPLDEAIFQGSEDVAEYLASLKK